MLPHSLIGLRPAKGVRVGLWCVRWLKHQDDVENTVLVLLTHSIQKHLEAIAVEVSELVEEVFASDGFNHAIQVCCLELPLHFAFGLDSFCGDLAPTDGLQSDTCFILAKEAHLPTQSQDRKGIPGQHR